MTQTVTNRGFATEAGEGLVLIDFWATWYGPCHIQAPILEQLSGEYDEDEVKIVKMDVDENPTILASFGIMSIPTLLLRRDGEVVEKMVDVHTKDQLQTMVFKHL